MRFSWAFAAVLSGVGALALGCGDTPPSNPDAGPHSLLDATPGRDVEPSPEDAGAVEPDAARPPGPRPDSDGDGLPDRVDPAPLGPNALLFGDDFDADDGAWLFSSVSMRIEAARGVLTVAAVEPFEREGWIGPRPAWSDYVAQSRLRITSVGDSVRPESGHAGIIVRAEQVTPSRYVTCGLDLRRGDAVLAEHRGTRVIELAREGAPARAGDWVEVTLVARRDIYTCDVSGLTLTGRSDGLVGGAVGFRSWDAAFEADWVRVYDL